MTTLNRHILVTGAHRSGTTWIGRMIALHPSVVYFHEPFNANSLNQAFGYKVDTPFFYVPGTAQEGDVYEAFNHLLRSVSYSYGLAISVCKERGLDVRTPLRFCKYLLLGTLQSKRALFKDPMALLSAGWLHDRFGLQVICVIRNPLAFTGSLKKMHWGFNFYDFHKQEHLVKAYLPTFAREIQRFCEEPRDIIDQACLLWNVLHAVIIRHRATYPGWLFLKHEALVQDPLSGFQQIFEYLGLRMTAKVQATIEKHTSVSNPVEISSPAYMPRNAKGSLDMWRTRLTASEIERVIHSTKDIARNFYRLQENEFV